MPLLQRIAFVVFCLFCLALFLFVLYLFGVGGKRIVDEAPENVEEPTQEEFDSDSKE